MADNESTKTPSAIIKDHDARHNDKLAKYVAMLCKAVTEAANADEEPCQLCMAKALMLGTATMYAELSIGLPERTALSVAKYAQTLAQATEVTRKAHEKEHREAMKEVLDTVLAVINHQQVPPTERN